MVLEKTLITLHYHHEFCSSQDSGKKNCDTNDEEEGIIPAWINQFVSTMIVGQRINYDCACVCVCVCVYVCVCVSMYLCIYVSM